MEDQLKEYLAQQMFNCSCADLGMLEKDSLDRAYDKRMAGDVNSVEPVCDYYPTSEGN